MAPTVGLGIVGSGFAARFHTENYQRVHGVDVRLVGVYSRRPEATAEFAKEYGFERRTTAWQSCWATQKSTWWTPASRIASTRRWRCKRSKRANTSS